MAQSQKRFDAIDLRGPDPAVTATVRMSTNACLWRSRSIATPLCAACLGASGKGWGSTRRPSVDGVRMAATGILRIDRLFTGGTGAPIGANDPDPEAVGVVQDFLIGHGFSGLPGLLSPARGKFGPKTTEAVQTFQHDHGLPQTEAVDQPTLQALVDVPASKPLAEKNP